MKLRIFKGYTIMEILVIIVIVGIMVGITLPSFTKSRERALGREANATLKLIAGVEKNYKLESVTSFYPSSGIVSDIDAINRNLSLSLTSKNWDYSIQGGADTFTIYADRNDTVSLPYKDCRYTLTYGDENPIVNSTTACP